MAIPTWQFVATDKNGVQLGEITNPTDPSVALALGQIPALTMTVPLWSPLAASISDSTTLIKAYRTDVLGTRRLIFNGPVIATEEVGERDVQTLAITAAGPYWRLTKRLVGASKTGFAYPASSTVDLADLAIQIVNIVNAVSWTGIGTRPKLGVTNQGRVDRINAANAAELIASLGSTDSSFEFQVTPDESFPAAGYQLGWFDIGPTIGGVSRNDAIFEYGTTRANCVGYKRQVSWDSILTLAYAAVEGWPDETTQDLRSATDAAAVAAYGLFEELVPENGIIDDALRDALVQFHIRVRKNPRQIVTFTPKINARPSPFLDYFLGDYVRARAVVRGVQRLDAMLRVWGIKFTLDKGGNESVELQLQQAV